MMSDIQNPSIDDEHHDFTELLAKIDQVLTSFSIDEIEQLVQHIEVCVPKTH